MRAIGKYLALVLFVQATVVLSDEKRQSQARKFFENCNEKALKVFNKNLLLSGNSVPI